MITNGINSNVNVSGLPTTLESNSQLGEAGFQDPIFVIQNEDGELVQISNSNQTPSEDSEPSLFESIKVLAKRHLNSSLGVGVGAAAGAAVGSVVPGIGTAIGAVVGGVIGCVASNLALDISNSKD